MMDLTWKRFWKALGCLRTCNGQLPSANRASVGFVDTMLLVHLRKGFFILL